MRFSVVPMDLSDANAFVAKHHRHHQPVVGHKFSIGAHDGESVRGVAIVGRPVARHRDDGDTLEVTRLCTDGAENCCSFLYGASWRAARALGYSRIGTYILASEPGSSLRASGWKLMHSTPGRSWNCDSRPREDKHPLGQRTLWEPRP